MDSEDWADAQADQCFHWAHISFCWFCQEVSHFDVAEKFKIRIMGYLFNCNSLSTEDEVNCCATEKLLLKKVLGRICPCIT